MARIQRLAPGKGEEPLCQFRSPHRGGLHDFGRRPEAIVVCERVDQCLRAPHHHRQQVVEIVRDTPGQLPERLKALRLLQLTLERHLLRNVTVDCQHRVRRTVLVAEQSPPALDDSLPGRRGLRALERQMALPLAIAQNALERGLEGVLVG